MSESRYREIRKWFIFNKWKFRLKHYSAYYGLHTDEQVISLHVLSDLELVHDPLSTKILADIIVCPPNYVHLFALDVSDVYIFSLSHGFCHTVFSTLSAPEDQGQQLSNFRLLVSSAGLFTMSLCSMSVCFLRTFLSSCFSEAWNIYIFF